MTQTIDQQIQQERLCQLAKKFLEHIRELEVTLEIMQSSYNATINQSNLTPREKEVLKHITAKVSPAGLRSLLEAIELTADSTKLLYVETYKVAAANLATTIYQQSGIAGPTGERTFSTKADGDKARIKEQCHQQTHVAPPVRNPNPTTDGIQSQQLEPKQQNLIMPQVIHNNEPAPAPAPTPRKPKPKELPATSNVNRYKQYLSKCTLLQSLNKAPHEPPSEVHAWVQACGYVMTSKEGAQASLGKGLDALLWPGQDGVNTVQKVEVLPHPCGSGNVFILSMEKPTTGWENTHLKIECAVWTPEQYPHSIVVEISSKVSRESPFWKKRKGWELIEQYLQETNNHESISPSNIPRSNSTAKYNLETI